MFVCQLNNYVLSPSVKEKRPAVVAVAQIGVVGLQAGILTTQQRRIQNSVYQSSSRICFGIVFVTPRYLRVQLIGWEQGFCARRQIPCWFMFSRV